MVLKNENKLNTIWLKAAALGSLWAANEIILGSFLHNIRFPLSGTLMSFFSVIFVVAFITRWPEKGLIIRAGFIAALMKSMAPSAIILGPMIGIIIEAAILELSFRIAKGKAPILFIGGGLAVSEVLLQKVFTLLISFGWNIMRMLEAMYQFVDKQMGNLSLNGNWAIIILLSFYMITGGIAAIIGIKAGKLSFNLERDIAAVPIFQQEKNRAVFADTKENRYSWPLLIFNFLVLFLGFYLIRIIPWYDSLIYILIYFVFIIKYYNNAFRHLKKPSFWISFFVITLLAAILFNHRNTGEYFSYQGFIIGIEMNIRAALVVISFAAIGQELKSPIIRALLYQKGLQNFYRALSLAFGILPESIKAFPSAKEIIRSPTQLIARLLLYAENLILELERRNKILVPVIIISGNIQEGKTTFAAKVVRRLQRENIKLNGFLSTVIYDNKERIGYKLSPLGNNDNEINLTLCSIKKQDHWIRQGKFYFNPEAIKKGNDILYKTTSDIQLTIIDEIGPLETKSKGWSPAIQHISEDTISPMLWVVRESLVKKISRKWPIGNLYYFKLSDDLPAKDVENMVIHILKNWKNSQQ